VLARSRGDYTGTYQMNNRVVANGRRSPRTSTTSPWSARRAGYDPTLFGYTDQGVDPNRAEGYDDPRLDNYDGVLPASPWGSTCPRVRPDGSSTFARRVTTFRVVG